MAHASKPPPKQIPFETHPDRYVHWKLAFDGPKPTQLVSEPSGALRPAMAGSHPPVALGIKTEPLKDEPGG